MARAGIMSVFRDRTVSRVETRIISRICMIQVEREETEQRSESDPVLMYGLLPAQ